MVCKQAESWTKPHYTLWSNEGVEFQISPQITVTTGGLKYEGSVLEILEHNLTKLNSDKGDVHVIQN